MLVLRRGRGEEIVIRDDIVITVLWISKGDVKLGIDAPEDVQIVRREVLDRRERHGGGGPCET